MSLFNIKDRKGGLMDEIRCDEPSYLIWKWHPAGIQLGDGNRENSVRLGSSLRVKDGEVAVFVYKQNNATAQDYIVGPFDQIIKTANLPVLSSLVGLAYEGGTPFQAEIYFINLAQIIQIRFGVPFFDVYDPRFVDFGVPIAVRGTISFSIADYREFIKLHRLNSFSLADFQKQVRDVVNRYMKDAVANAPASHNIPLVQIESRISQINDVVEYDIAERLREDFGVLVSGVDISAIEIDKTSEGYHRLMMVTKDIAAARTKAETEDYIERLRIQREEGQYAQHKSTQSANIGAFQTEKQAEVGIAGANALGQMGANGAGSVELGGTSGTGFNPAAMMAGMAVGSAVGQNIAGTMSSIMSDNTAQTTPPPIPQTVYNVAVNGQSTGPYDIETLKIMAQSGKVDGETLVWKPGMTSWNAVKSVNELSDVMSAIPPIPPTA